MDKDKQVLLRIPQSVIADTLNFRNKLGDFLNGQTSDVAFRAYRVPMGIYEQRKTGSFMARIRIGAGLVLPYQLKKIAELSQKYGDSIVHVTTRQDLQIHDLKIEDTADVLEQLLDANLSTRGGGGNTVRNISACPRTGICPNEIFDVAPHAIAVAEYLLQSNDSFNLPRKYKIVFSGCSNDCGLASVADLGFFAHIKDGKKGFAVYGAGGLGGSPNVAIKLEDFVEEKEIFEVAQTIKEIFDKHGDRTDKHKARLRYVLKRFGEDGFKKLYNQKREEIKVNGLKGNLPKIREIKHAGIDSKSDIDSDYASNVLPEKNEGLFTVKLHLRFGDIPADDLIKVADIAQKYSKDYIRTTQLQDLLIASVPGQQIANVCDELKKLSIDVFGKSKANIVTCTGADTCKLGLCLSKGLAKAISEKLQDFSGNKNLVRISGCPNSCGHHHITSIGLQGRAKRVNGKLMPCYDVLTGAIIAEGKSNLSTKVGTLPAKDVPDFLKDVYSQNCFETEKFEELLNEIGGFTRDFPDDYFYDYGACKPFSLKGRGPGECGAGVMDVIKVDIDQAKQGLKKIKKAKDASTINDNIYKSVISAARALLVIFGHEPKKDREIVKLFNKELIDAGWVAKESQALLESAIDWKLGDIETICDGTEIVENLVKRVEELFYSLDAGLKFAIEPLTAVNEQETTQNNLVIDLRGVDCPLNFVKAKLELEKIDIGQPLEILLDDGEPIRNVPASFESQGHEILSIDKENDYFKVTVKRRK